MQLSDSQFQAIAENIPTLCWMAKPDGYIVWYNRRWYEYTGTTPAEMEGWGWQSVHDPDRLSDVLERWQASIATGQPFEMVFPLRGVDGQFRPFLTRVRPAVDGAGAITGWFGVNADIAEQVRAEEALRDSDARFRALADTMPQMVWSAGPDGRADYYNARWDEFIGIPVATMDRAAWNEVLHPEERDVAWARWRQAVVDGEPLEIEYRLRHRFGDYRWMLARTQPQRAADGKIIRWFGTCTDINEAKRLAEERSLVARELDHRIGNIFSVISGLVHLSAHRFPDAGLFATELRHRIVALGRAHEFVRPHGDVSKLFEVKLFAMLQELLAPYQDGGRIALRGEDLAIDERSVTPLALLFHELATNAAKYGSLSVTTGRVTISSALNDDAFELTWREEEGPVVAAPARTGFGSELARLSIEGQLGGTLKYDWCAGGLTVTARVPVTAIMPKFQPTMQPST